jgi:hypothetical protein
MRMSLLDSTSHATYHHGFVWCSMKSIGRVSLCNKLAPWVVCNVSIRVATSLYLMIYRVSHAVYQTALLAASDLIVEKLKNGSCVPFSSQTTQGQNIPLKRYKTEIWGISSPNQSQSFPKCISQFLSIISYLSEIHKRFLHACTPERRTRVCAHLFKQGTYGQVPYPTKHILQKKRSRCRNVGKRYER